MKNSSASNGNLGKQVKIRMHVISSKIHRLYELPMGYAQILKGTAKVIDCSKEYVITHSKK